MAKPNFLCKVVVIQTQVLQFAEPVPLPPALKYEYVVKEQIELVKLDVLKWIISSLLQLVLRINKVHKW